MTDRRPIPLGCSVSKQLSKMPTRGTNNEIALRRELHRRGLRFRVNVRSLPGTPDLAFSRAKIAVFCDGCFWHACPDHGILPKNNREWWRKKFEANQVRDREKDEELKASGWLPVHVWEHEDTYESADRIEELWRLRTGRLDADAFSARMSGQTPKGPAQK